MNNPIGIISGLKKDMSNLQEIADMGLSCCQLMGWDESMWTTETANQVKKVAQSLNIEITSFWAGWPGPMVWDFVDGPTTLGIVPVAFRAARLETLRRAGDFAKELGIQAVVTHLGFIPENPTDSQFAEVVASVKYLATYYKSLGIEFWFETGQETPVTMLRLIEQVNIDNLGINLDPANLVMYGKANAIDSLEVFGKYVKSIHAKDGMYPTDPMKLGKEVKVGTGKVQFPEFVKALDKIGFDGAYIIERETSGEQQKLDIIETVSYLKGL